RDEGRNPHARDQSVRALLDAGRIDFGRGDTASVSGLWPSAKPSWQPAEPFREVAVRRSRADGRDRILRPFRPAWAMEVDDAIDRQPSLAPCHASRPRTTRPRVVLLGTLYRGLPFQWTRFWGAEQYELGPDSLPHEGVPTGKLQGPTLF